MRIPTAETEIGIWYPIGDCYCFMSVEVSGHEYCRDNYLKKYRSSTYAEFKAEFPYPAYLTSSNKFRSRTKHKR